MLETLIDNIINYKDPQSVAINQGTYYIEPYYNGYMMTHPKSSIIFCNDGTVHRLSTKCNIFEWNLHCELYDIVQKSGNRIEIPVSSYQVLLENTEYYYQIVKRPAGELGQNFFEQCESDVIDTNYFLEYIDQTTSMLNDLVTLCRRHNHHYLPRELLAPYKRNKDSAGYFWLDFKAWSFPFDKFIEKKIRTLYLTLLSLNVQFDYSIIMHRAESQWHEFSKI